EQLGSFGRFSHRQILHYAFGFIGHWPLFRATGHCSPATRHLRPDQRGQVVRRPSPAGDCLRPTAELTRTERSPISTSGPSISVSLNEGGHGPEPDIRSRVIGVEG